MKLHYFFFFSIEFIDFFVYLFIFSRRGHLNDEGEDELKGL